MAGKCSDHDKVIETLIRNAAALEGYAHEAQRDRELADLRHKEMRDDMKDLKATLKPVAAAAIAMTQTQTQGTPSPGGDWSKLWISLLILATVVVGALFVKFGFVTPALATTQGTEQTR